MSSDGLSKRQWGHGSGSAGGELRVRAVAPACCACVGAIRWYLCAYVGTAYLGALSLPGALQVETLWAIIQRLMPGKGGGGGGAAGTGAGPSGLQPRADAPFKGLAVPDTRDRVKVGWKAGVRQVVGTGRTGRGAASADVELPP